jgi:ADP-heptose:LPS heptosyltransferase
VPALRALDAAHPQARITLIGLPRLREAAARLERYIDHFIAFPGFPGMPEAPGEPPFDLNAVPDFFAQMKRESFDLAIQMHGSGEIANPLMVLMGASHNGGYYRPGRYCPDGERYLKWQEGEDEVQRWLRLVAHLGAPAQGSFLEFPLQPEDWAEWRALRLERYVCLQCATKSQRYAEVADALAAEGWNVVPIELGGRASLGGTAAVIAKASLVLSSDPDARLIAAAMRTPAAPLSPDVRQTLRQARELLTRTL